MAEASNVQVAVRVRPFNSREKARKSKLIIKMRGQTTTIVDPVSTKEKEFNFDYSYWSHDGYAEEEDTGLLKPTAPEYADQDKVFQDLGQGVLANAWEGYNCSLFAYGQTGSGKSYSMVGYGQNKGIVPVTCNNLFSMIEEKRKDEVECQVTFSMLEIYNEQVQDLLSNKTVRGGMKVRLHPKKGFYVDGLSVVPVANFREIEEQMDEGTKRRTIAATNMNATSSRAHTIVTVNFQQKANNASGTSMTKSSSINLVDLAGSERADATGATGDRLKEGAAINQSLSTLGNVISALVEAQGSRRKVVIPFRDSVLTKLLKNALGGNSKTIMIAALSPADINYDETLSTLRFADRVKSIKTVAVINETPTERLIRELREENQRLLDMIKGGGAVQPAAGSGAASEEELARIKAEAAEELERELARNAREMEEMQKSWQEKLKEAHAKSAVATDAADKEKEEKATVPHLWNLNEDPALAGVICHFMRPGKETRVGNGKSDPPPSILCRGVNMMPEHAVIRNDGKKLYIQRLSEKASILVNGDELGSEQVQLHHHYRVLFGPSHLFVVTIPKEAAAAAKAGKKQKHPTWEDAQAEIAQHTGLTTEGVQDPEDLLIQEELISLMPHVNEANAMSEEMGKGKFFEIVLVSAQARGLKEGRPETRVKVRDMATGASWMWSRNRFLNRKFAMQEMYQDYTNDPDGKEWDRPEDADPFHEPHDSDEHIGFVNVYLASLGYLIEIEEQLTLRDYRGVEQGILAVDILPCKPSGAVLAEDDEMFVDDPEELVGQRVDYQLKIQAIKGLPSNYSKVYCRYRFLGDTEDFTTDTVDVGVTADFGYARQLTQTNVTSEWISEIAATPMAIEVWGRQGGKPLQSSSQRLLRKQSSSRLGNSGRLGTSGLLAELKDAKEAHELQCEISTQKRRVDRLQARLRAIEVAFASAKRKKGGWVEEAPLAKAIETKTSRFKPLVNAVIAGNRASKFMRADSAGKAQMKSALCSVM